MRRDSVPYVRSPSPRSTCRAPVFTRGIRVRVLEGVGGREQIVEDAPPLASARPRTRRSRLGSA